MKNIETKNAVTVIAPKKALVAPAKKITKAETKPIVAATETKAESVKPAFIRHEITGTYAMASRSFGKHKSRTPINAVYNSLANAHLTDRDNAFLYDLKKHYGVNKAFPRGDADAGNLRRAIERGYINYVQADYVALCEQAFVLTEKCSGLSFK